jgi:acyl carrier protein
MNNKTIDLLNQTFIEFVLPVDFNTKLRDISGWDSLTSFMLIDIAKENFGVLLEIRDLADMSLKDLDKVLNC